MGRKLLFVFTGISLFCNLSWAGDREILRFIYCSDVHYGLEREFRGAATPADSVSRAMIAAFRMLEDTVLPEDGGVAAGEIYGTPNFVVCTGDIANRMEDGVQSATESWRQFCSDWSSYCTFGDTGDAADWTAAGDTASCTHTGVSASTGDTASWTASEKTISGEAAGDTISREASGETISCVASGRVPLYLVPGNHDVSNAIGYPKPLEPARDDASAAGIYNMMMSDTAASQVFGNDGTTGVDGFDYSTDKTHYSFVMDGIRFVFMGMWPDSHMREWFDKETAGDKDVPAFIFTHDPPEADAKHFTNPDGKHDINPVDRFQNLLTDTCSVKSVDRKPKCNWRILEKFISSHPDIKAYFHGDMNYNEFYTWKGVDGSISLPVFRVDSPMKGFDSSSDETLMSFIVVTIEPENMRLTARECLWNADRAPGIKWGATATIAY